MKQATLVLTWERAHKHLSLLQDEEEEQNDNVIALSDHLDDSRAVSRRAVSRYPGF